MSITKRNRDFPGSPMVRTWHFHCCGPGQIHEMWPKIQVRKKEKKQTHRYREQTSGYQWGEGRGLRVTHHYI